MGEHRDDVVFAGQLADLGDAEAAGRCRARAETHLERYPAALDGLLAITADDYANRPAPTD